MKFYVIGSKDPNFIISTKKSAFASEDLEKSLDAYIEIVNEIRYDHIYFIADFEDNKRKLFDKAVSLEYDSERMPFFIIGDWHIGEDQSTPIRADHTYIKIKGFVHEFENNLTAIREYKYNFDQRNVCTMKIMYSRGITANGKAAKKKYSRLVAETISSMRMKEPAPIKKIKITKPNWDFVPLCDREFQVYQASAPEKSYKKELKIPQIMLAK